MLEVCGFYIQDEKNNVTDYGIGMANSREELLDILEPYVRVNDLGEALETVDVIPIDEMLTEQYDGIAFCVADRPQATFDVETVPVVADEESESDIDSPEEL